MDELDDFVRRADEHLVHLSIPADQFGDAPFTATLIDAVRIPIAALALVAVASEQTRGIRVSTMGALVGSALLRTYPQFRHVGRRLEWSLRVRRTCAEALTFLEAAGIMAVTEGHDGTRNGRLTLKGSSFLRAMLRDRTTEVGELMHRLTVAAGLARIEEMTLL